MSLGVNLLAALVKRVAQSLDGDFDIEILEMHHRPRSTRPRARHNAGRGGGRGRKIALVSIPGGRDGITGARRQATSALRHCAAHVTGEHSVIFRRRDGAIELTHRAEIARCSPGRHQSRAWARDKKAWTLSMADVLGLGEF